MSASTAYRPVHGGFPGEPHVHVYNVPIIRRPSSPPFYEMLDGWRCECGERRPVVVSFTVKDQLSAAMRYIAERYGVAATAELTRGYREGGLSERVREAWTRHGGGDDA